MLGEAMLNGSVTFLREAIRLRILIAAQQARQKRLEQEPETGPHAMVRRLGRVVGIGIETADMLVHEVLSRPMRDRKAKHRRQGARATA